MRETLIEICLEAKYNKYVTYDTWGDERRSEKYNLLKRIFSEGYDAIEHEGDCYFISSVYGDGNYNPSHAMDVKMIKKTINTNELQHTKF